MGDKGKRWVDLSLFSTCLPRYQSCQLDKGAKFIEHVCKVNTPFDTRLRTLLIWEEKCLVLITWEKKQTDLHVC